jgi:hypothetical protein
MMPLGCWMMMPLGCSRSESANLPTYFTRKGKKRGDRKIASTPKFLQHKKGTKFLFNISVFFFHSILRHKKIGQVFQKINKISQIYTRIFF